MSFNAIKIGNNMGPSVSDNLYYVAKMILTDSGYQSPRPPFDITIPSKRDSKKNSPYVQKMNIMGGASHAS